MSYIQISRENFLHNLSQTALKTGSIEKVALVLKDNAYGHGLRPIAELAAQAGVHHAVVRSLAEASALAGTFETVLVLSCLPDRVPSRGVRIAVNDRSDIAKIPAGSEVELKIDTGMHRNGIPMAEAEAALEEAQERGLRVAGVMTHYRAADEMGSDFFRQKSDSKRSATASKTGSFPACGGTVATPPPSFAKAPSTKISPASVSPPTGAWRCPLPSRSPTCGP